MNDTHTVDKSNILIYIDDLCRTNKYNDDIELLFKKNIIHPNDDDGFLISIAASYGNLKMLKLFKKYGGNMNIRDNEPLRLASQNGCIDCVEFLYDNFIDISN